MANQIVTLNVSQTVAPAPSTLQRSGAFVSHGGTNTSPGTLSLLTQPSDLTPLLALSINITSMSWAGGVVTATAVTPHGYTIGDTPNFIISGVAPVGYNGTFQVIITGASTFTYNLTLSPGSVVVQGNLSAGSANTLSQMTTSFFSQGSGVGVYVLELGPSSATKAVVSLDAWIIANPRQIYSFLLPRSFNGGTPGLLALLSKYNYLTAVVNFFITTTLSDYVNFSKLLSCAFVMLEAPAIGAYPANQITQQTWTAGMVTLTMTTAHGVVPGQWFTIAGSAPSGYNGIFLAAPGTTAQTIIYAQPLNPGLSTSLGNLQSSSFTYAGAPPTEFSCAAAFQVSLNYAPSSVNKVTPFAFAYLFGVTPFPVQGNAALLTTLKAAGVNWVGTGAEGGISNTILYWGTMMDGRDFTYWYSVDWVEINIDLDLANEIIGGSNNPFAPLDYDQPGINRLQVRAQGTLNRGITYALVLPPATVSAVPFATYVAQNPSDYPAGVYNGLAVSYTPQRGFKALTFNLNVTDFPATA